MPRLPPIYIRKIKYSRELHNFRINILYNVVFFLSLYAQCILKIKSIWILEMFFSFHEIKYIIFLIRKENSKYLLKMSKAQEKSSRLYSGKQNRNSEALQFSRSEKFGQEIKEEVNFLIYSSLLAIGRRRFFLFWHSRH